MKWEQADDVKNELDDIVLRLKDFEHIDPERVFCFRTYGAKTRAYARIWGFPKIFQQVLSVQPAYVIEVVSEKFNKLSDSNKKKVLIHELLHIPRNFSGSLLPHKHSGRTIDKEVERLYKNFK
jgi:predicted metallopeptidase